ncbi:mRNA cleavage and polyadenylation specificity factor complex subunit [Aspergillus uvarum CBS 121591]|uniref:mRNA cleavage and polyadenylation specificity factor complex subunit n=1 Tax=Aspergillus uvarum CBS 121591 TaxID=1448315 RepID=A0A319C0F3_9EURO|nr:mRNA cleavage and polyadenylation specificity factor complex subunit [Aspergillus uvarum CBS 121591]PYH77801.1 mRNA cleavage and polyadenylation specificity factor complex subunit [Aspergillus uvarum CBS 121591]
MAQSADHLGDQIAQLNAARNLVLGDAAFYPQIVNGVLPIIGSRARLELRRWGAEFLAETFSSPALALTQKEQLAANVLQAQREILELPEGDPLVLKHIVQNAASLYPLVFRHIINHPRDGAIWENMTAIKQGILRRWDSFPSQVKICCIKFVQRVVQVQTHGPIADPRRPDQNETSLAIVPRNHPVLSLPNLEAEASGLLDRLLSALQEESSDPILVNATLNCLAVLIRSRQSIGNKIINAIMNFFPARQVRPPITPAVRVGVKSMERTARAVLEHIMKRNANHPFFRKMEQHVDRLKNSRLEIVDDATRKRGPPAEPTDGLDKTKRTKLDAETPPVVKIPPLPPGPTSYSQLFTLTEDAEASRFDVKQLPPDLLVNIVVPILARVDESALTQSIDAIRMRYETIQKRQAAQAPAVVAATDDDDDYEPEYQPMDVAEPVREQADAEAAEVAEIQPDLVSLGPFVLPQPPPLSEAEAAEVGRSAVGRVFGMLASSAVASNPAKGKNQQQPGFARLAGSTFDRDAWVTLLTRLATRAPAGLEAGTGKFGQDASSRGKSTISNTIRETLYRYILEDFRGRVNVGIMWLNEEWYNDRVQMQFTASQRRSEDEEATVPLFYDHWVLRLLDGFLPYIDSRDTKIFIRFLSEIPEVTIPITQRVASLAKDPERVNLCVQSLLYLIMFRPPAREICLNAMEHVYETYEESRPAAGKVLAKWRPKATQPQPEQQTTLASRGATTGTSATPVGSA